MILELISGIEKDSLLFMFMYIYFNYSVKLLYVQKSVCMSTFLWTNLTRFLKKYVCRGGKYLNVIELCILNALQ